MSSERYYLLTGAADFFIRLLFSRKGETVEQTRERLSKK